jgi:hypothetical protein
MVFRSLDKSQRTFAFPCSVLVCKHSLLSLRHKWRHIDLLLGRVLAIDSLTWQTQYIAIAATSIAKNVVAV